ncbi:uncharacterized protein LOC114325124 isoform X1 [Diabrotica virgifera virgifera]|uniref:Uncharacterized protein LOC114325124 isoform X1 n=1 Tax=Diabrotica virgifera virgifera TaxID=50390 RepID=A0A6P7F602_DIAVI|nr:uncharacterized protein LOC114325124 isoform X1 [Diabrotica virgifera virgifera]
MHRYLHLCVFLSFVNGVLLLCDDSEFVRIHNRINTEKENIGNELLDHYDVLDELKELVKILRKHINEAEDKLKELETNNNNAINKIIGLNSTEETLFEELKIIKDYLDKLNTPDISITGVQNNTDSVENILKELNILEKDVDNLVEKYDLTNVTRKIMNIPHSVAEDLSILEKVISEDDNSECMKGMEEDLKSLFKELATLLDFQHILQDIEELKEISYNVSITAAEEVEFVHDLLLEEEQAKVLKKLAKTYQDYEEEYNYIMKELESENCVDVEQCITQTEKDITEYTGRSKCISIFLNNCYVKKPSESNGLHKCVKKGNECWFSAI